MSNSLKFVGVILILLGFTLLWDNFVGIEDAWSSEYIRGVLSTVILIILVEVLYE